MELYRSPANRFVAGFLGSPGMNFVPGRMEQDGDALAFTAEGGELRLRVAPREGLAAGRAVVLGIRPEDVHLNGSAPASATRAILRLDAAETMGNETIVTLAAGAHEIVARIPPRALPAPGETVEAAFDVDRLHFFDPESGAAVAG
jgi:multiple sugar transport system ATP-binding protein